MILLDVMLPKITMDLKYADRSVISQMYRSSCSLRRARIWTRSSGWNMAQMITSQRPFNILEVKARMKAIMRRVAKK
mgnify:CR=1 FL=1